MTSPDPPEAVFEVSVAGLLGPVGRAAFPAQEVLLVPSATVLRVDVRDGQGAADVAGLVRSHGLVLLGLRQLASGE